MRYITNLILFYLVFCAFNAPAQILNIRNYNVENGLAQSQVYAIVQDNNGYLWFGTANGLSKFDGKEFQNFNRNAGLTTNFVESGFKDKQGNLWFGHSNCTVTKFNWQTQNFENIFLLEGSQKIVKSPIYTIYQDFNEGLWFTSAGCGLFYLQDDSVLQITEEDGLLSNLTYDILQFPDSSFWISTDKGISSIHYCRHSHNYYCDTLRIENLSPGRNIRAMLADFRGNVWLGIKEVGLSKLKLDKDGKPVQITNYGDNQGFSSENVWDIIEDNHGHLWIGTMDQGAFKYLSDPEQNGEAYFSRISESNGLKSNYVSTVFADDENNLWFGTDGAGVAQLRDQSIEIYNKLTGLADECIWTIREDSDGSFWFGHDKGFSSLSFPKNQNGPFQIANYSQVAGYRIARVMDIFEDSRKNIWISSMTAPPIRYNLKTKQMQVMEFKKKFGFKDIVSANEDNEGKVWFGSMSSGILTYHPANDTYHRINKQNSGISSDLINTIFKDSLGRLWFGTENGGVMCFEGHDFKIYAPQTGYPITSAISITEDGSGNMWFISGDDVIYRLSNDGMEIIPDLEYIDGQAIYSLLAAGDNIWLGSTQGVARILVDDWKVSYFGSQQGYPIYESNQNAVLRDRRGKIWFGTIKGAVRIDPDQQKKIATLPKINLTKIQIFLEDAKLPESRKLKYNQNYLTFHYRGISHTIPELIKYRYYLEGFDKRWSPVITDDYATYSNLSPGNYVFKVLACNADGKWSYKPAIIEFEILAPFWLTWWFYLLCFILAGLLIYTFIKYRMQEMEKIKRVLEKKVKERTKELLEEKKKVEEINTALLAEKERLAVTLRSTGEGVITTDSKGRIVLMNPAAEKICGLTQVEAIDKHLLEIFCVINEKTNKPITDPIRKIVNSGQIYSSKYNNILFTKDGARRNISYSGSPIREKGSEIVGVVLVFSDISEQLQIEKELFKSQKLESLGILAGGIAHDFNNILTAITGNISLVKMHLKSGQRIYHSIEIVENAARRAQELIQQLLTFSKGGAPVKETTSILDLVKESTEFVLRGSKIKLELNFDQDVLAVDVDPGQINQVIHNIILNSYQAMPSGGSIIIKARNTQIPSHTSLPITPGSYVQIEISDNGPGIDKKLLQKVFDPFFTTKKNGNGLGLASAYSIIKRHEGHILLDSEIGKGTTFTILIPSSTKKLKKKAPKENGSLRGQGKILIMDDEYIVRDTASEMLSFLGFQVECVKDGKEVIEKYKFAALQNEPYDVVIMDLTIPGGMGGETAMKKLLTLDPQAKAVVSSGYSSDPIMSNYNKYGFKGCLKKPFNIEEVGKLLQDILGN